MSSHTDSSGRITRMLVAAIFATITVVPASFAQQAAKNGVTPSVTVGYADLNLATAEGSRVLYRRVLDAARKVCPDIGLVAELRNNRDARQCIADTVERTLKQVKSPQLARVAATERR